ncbi:MAG: hypothetical protein K2O32_01995 [Acetatifactor sp.]|nr:hypothetical protein [Acetatifactor sp.]
MKTYHDFFAEKLYRSFPETPESFQRVVSEAVETQLNSTRGGGKSGWRAYKALIPAACLFLAGGTVAAAGLPVFQNWLTSLGANADIVEEAIIHDIDSDNTITMNDTALEEAPFTVTDAYYDGAAFMFWVKSSSDFFDLGDHVYINGIDSRLEYVAETQEGSGIYECKVSVLDGELQEKDMDAIQVKVGLYTSPDSKSDYSFTIESDKLGSAMRANGDIQNLDFGQIVSYTVTASSSVTNLQLKWEVNDAGMVDTLRFGDYMIEDASGKRLTRNEWLRSCSYSEYEEKDTCVTFTQDLEITGFDASSPTMTLIPVRVQWDADGMQIPGSEEILEDCAITIDLK